MIKINAIISTKPIELDNYKHFNTIESCLASKIDKFGDIFIIGIESVSLWQLVDCVKLSTLSERLIICMNLSTKISSTFEDLGFLVSKTYDEYALINSQEDLDVILKTCTCNTREVIKESAICTLNNLEKSIEELTELVSGQKNYYEISESTLNILNEFNVFKNHIIKNYCNNINRKNEQINVFIKNMVDEIKIYSSKITELEIKSKNAVEDRELLLNKYEETKNELDILKSSLSFSFFMTCNVDKSKTDSRIIYIRELSTCVFLPTFLFNYKLFLTEKKVNSLVVIVQKFNDFNRPEGMFLSEKNISSVTVAQLFESPFIFIEEPSSNIINFLLQITSFKAIILLDRTYSATPVLKVTEESGIQLYAVGSKKDITKYNLQPNDTITSIDNTRNARYCIPYIKFPKNATIDVKSTLYIEQCSSIYIELSKKTRLLRNS